MRTFECYDCDHVWQLAHGEGGKSDEVTCPKCNGKRIHRLRRGSTHRRGPWSRSAALRHDDSNRKKWKRGPKHNQPTHRRKTG